MERVLVIKLSALGDFIQATGVFNDIRAAHPHAEITLMTSKPMMFLAEKHPAFNQIAIDPKPKFWQLKNMCTLKKFLKEFDMVYDLQNNDRTNWYFKLAGKPKWSGIAKGCSHPQILEDRRALHNLDRIEDQLKQANINTSHKPDVTYAQENASPILKKHNLKKGTYAVIVAGCSPQHPKKRWGKYVELIKELEQKNIPTVLVGTKAEEQDLNNIAKQTKALNLCNQTSIGELIDLFQKSACAIGNDTGPMHIAAASLCPKGLTIFGEESPGSNWRRCAPKAKGFSVIHQKKIDDNSVKDVLEALKL